MVHIALVFALAACTVGLGPAPRTVAHWSELGHNLWIDERGTLGFRTEAATEERILDPIYITTIDGQPLSDVLDLDSFHFAGAQFYADKARVYHHRPMAGGGGFRVFEHADRATFDVIGPCHARDKHGIYSARGTKLDVDIASFETHADAGCFAKDNDGYFFWDERVDPKVLDDREMAAIARLDG